MKTRSNMPLFVVECEDVKALSNTQIDLLRCGDYLVKKDASGEHAYKVTYKSATGMCLTYMDASVIETQSYDKIDGVWTYNSEDKTPNLLKVQNVEDAPSGTIVDALGLNADGDLVKGAVSGGTQWYKHTFKLGTSASATINFAVISLNSTPITSFDTFLSIVGGGQFRMAASKYYLIPEVEVALYSIGVNSSYYLWPSISEYRNNKNSVKAFHFPSGSSSSINLVAGTLSFNTETNKYELTSTSTVELTYMLDTVTEL